MELYLGIVSWLPMLVNDILTMQICASPPATKQFFNRYIPKVLGTSVFGRTAESTANPRTHMDSDRMPAHVGDGFDFEMGVFPSAYESTRNKDDTRVRVGDWSSSRGTIVASHDVDDMASIKTIRADGRYTLHREDSKEELVVTPSRSQPDYHDAIG
jgi:hypothetical protein